ncbi:MAG: preprotein translocase subunit SecE [Spirochaetaceae bacterium]|nr:preprotein translocase subunit SecE [Spirochaetaceae bacterium]MDD9988582.1 preprotein translocase subunit SecE [Spirochaetaceae bacterium]MDE0221530.1 preprotein translocase subunit SecE [Spirochaetaceae bacterium]
MGRIIQFFRESYGELRKVAWPSREEVASSTKVVLVSVSLIALALGLIDFLLFQAIDLVF